MGREPTSIWRLRRQTQASTELHVLRRRKHGAGLWGFGAAEAGGASLFLLLRLMRRRTLRSNSELDPPDGKPRQASRRDRSERRPVVGTNHVGQAEFEKRLMKDLLHGPVQRLLQPAALPQKPAVAVRDSQRMAVAPPHQELALEVGAPNRIRTVERAQLGTIPDTGSSSTPLGDQSAGPQQGSLPCSQQGTRCEDSRAQALPIAYAGPSGAAACVAR